MAVSPPSNATWDIVVLTALDVNQQQAYEKQLSLFCERNSFTQHGVFRVFPDEPDNVKIGSGGATLLAIDKLHKEFGATLFEKRILILHAGGLCQRHPIASISGKIFSLLPRKSPEPYCMLDLKLKLYLRLLPAIPPGIFVAAADALEYFELGTNGPLPHFPVSGFTSLAHPSPIDIGVGHGVFVFEHPENISRSGEFCIMLPVSKVLQKPCVEMILESGAVVTSDSGECDKHIYTDSAYFMATDVVRKMLELYAEICPLNCEIDAYGDFIQCLGTNSSPAYIQDTKNVVSQTESLLIVRRKVYDALHTFPITALVLNKSQFYHIGSLQELLGHFCCYSLFHKRFSLASVSFTRILPAAAVSENSSKNTVEDFEECSKTEFVKGCVCYSILSQASIIPSSSYVEYCHFPLGITIGQRSILSNCCFTRHAIELSEDGLFLSTYPVNIDGQLRFTTVVFGTQDNLKLSMKDATELNKLKFLNNSYDLQTVLSLLQLDAETVFGGRTAAKTTTMFSLWNAKLFPLFESREESFSGALKFLDTVFVGGKKLIQETITDSNSKNGTVSNSSSASGDNGELVSMADVLKQKNIDDLLNYQSSLYKLIKQ